MSPKLQAVSFQKKSFNKSMISPLFYSFHPVAFMAYSTSTLAQGCFGKVYREKYNDTWAAVKRVPFHLINRKDLERECDVYK